MRKISTMFLLVLMISSASLIAQFTKIVTPVTGGLPFAQLQDGDAAWGDYDADGDIDLVINGRDGSFINRIFIYANNGDGSFSIADSDTSFGTTLQGLYNAGVAWGDFDNDGDLDFVQNGSDDAAIRRTWLYENTPTGFVLNSNPVNGTEPFIGSTSFDPNWVDFNNDGKLDLYVSGTPTSIGGIFNYNKLYQGNGDGTFIPVDSPVELEGYLDGYRNGSAVWGDTNNDGYMDLFSQGESGFQGINSTLYLGKGDSTFSLAFRGNTSGSPILTSGGGRFGGTKMVDYDNDGDLDLFFSGESKGGGRFSALYANNGDNTYSFVANIGGGFRGFTGALGFGSSWGDFDGDGDNDLAYGGFASTSSFVDIEENKGNNIFEELVNPVDGSADFDAFTPNSLEFGDYDNDGDLDLLANSGDEEVILYQNTLNHSNTRPEAPTNLSMKRTPEGVLLSWDSSTDDMTASTGLSYELRVGTASGISDVVAPKAIISGASEGKRILEQRGNIQANWAKLNLPLGSYFWSVQAVDPGLKGSLFATEGTFVVEEYVASPPAHFSLLYPADEEDTLTVTPAWFSWQQAEDDIDVSDSLVYTFELSDQALFSSILDSSTIKRDTTYSTSLSLMEGEYFWRVSVKNSSGLTTWGSSSDTMPFSFSINSFVPRPPSIFNLLLPINGDTLVSAPNQFLWSQSTDATDSFSDLMYTFELSNSATFETKLDSITFSADTSFISNKINGTGEYYWRVRATNSFDSTNWGSASDLNPFKFTIVNATPNELEESPLSFKLDQNYPNPFNPSTIISYSIPKASLVSIEVFNLLGQKVSTLVSEKQSIGSYNINFDASELTSGIYIYQLKAGAYIQTRKMLLIK